MLRRLVQPKHVSGTARPPLIQLILPRIFATGFQPKHFSAYTGMGGASE
jgi:hypothetical protein